MEKTKRHIKSDAVKKLEDLAFDEVKRKYPNFPFPVKPRYSDRTTNGLTACVIDYFHLRGYQAERINTTGTQIEIGGKKKWVKGSSQTGSADISAIVNGRAVKIEIKCEASGDRYQSPEQKEYESQVKKAGGVYLVIRTFQQLYDIVNRKKV